MKNTKYLITLAAALSMMVASTNFASAESDNHYIETGNNLPQREDPSESQGAASYNMPVDNAGWLNATYDACEYFDC